MKVAMNLAAKLIVNNEEKEAAGFICLQDVVDHFLKENPEYQGCSWTKEYSNEEWTICFWTTSEVVYVEQ